MREVWGSIPGPVKSTQCRQRLATAATFLRSCVAQALSRGDMPRHSLHASAYERLNVSILQILFCLLYHVSRKGLCFENVLGLLPPFRPYLFFAHKGEISPTLRNTDLDLNYSLGPNNNFLK